MYIVIVKFQTHFTYTVNCNTTFVVFQKFAKQKIQMQYLIEKLSFNKVFINSYKLLRSIFLKYFHITIT